MFHLVEVELFLLGTKQSAGTKTNLFHRKHRKYSELVRTFWYFDSRMVQVSVRNSKLLHFLYDDQNQ